jgi:hypothetical protein
MTDEAQRKIIQVYLKKVHGKKPDTSSSNPKHEGKGGHWLEDAMGSKKDADNAPDLFGFEMKNNTQSKTSFGDWSASYYIYKDEKFFPDLSEKKGKAKFAEIRKNKTQFLKMFGRAVNGRFSWSGTPCPKRATDGTNGFGQELMVTDDNSIIITYSFSKDKRENKSELIPKEFQKEDLVIAEWEATWIKEKVESKFNQKGWFKCFQDDTGSYNSIAFGDPISIERFLELVKAGDIMFDSGMADGKSRLYSMWRANNPIWEKLIVSRHP